MRDEKARDEGKGSYCAVSSNLECMVAFGLRRLMEKKRNEGKDEGRDER